MTWAGATLTDVVTGITFLLGILLCVTSGVWFQHRQHKPWYALPWEDEIVFSLTALSLGLVFLHIAMSRIYLDDIAYHLFDLNSVWTAWIRTQAVVMVFASLGRIADRPRPTKR